MFYKLFAFVLGCLLLCSCATTSKIQPSQASPSSQPQQQAQLSALHNWTITSALSIKQAQRSLIGSLIWQQNGNNFNQTFYAPFNFGSARIEGHPGQVTLWRSAENKMTASSPEQLLQQQLGWQWPVSNLYYWVRGLPVPNVPAQTKYDAAGHLITLNQAGYELIYSDYHTVNNMDLPGKIELRSSQIQARLVIKRWQI
jgi:outer membrane lipoprotein LolB